jgi:RNA polymerase sigma-70 factor (ECF subfamily)
MRTEAGEELEAAVRAARAGDRHAMELVLARMRPLVLRYCRARLGPSPTAEDIAQEICLAVVAALPGYQDRGGSFLPFVYGIAAHKLADSRRAAGREKSHPVGELPEPAAPAGGSEGPLLAAESTRRVERLLNLLPPQQREILILRVILGFSAAETGQAIGLAPTAARVAQHRALARLRTQLAATEQAA